DQLCVAPADRRLRAAGAGAAPGGVQMSAGAAALSSRAARAALPVAVASLAALVLASLAGGGFPPARVWAGLWGQDELGANILWNLRLPRLIVAMLVGTGLAGSGLVMQAFF